jgi:hypothetical protein
LTTSPAAVAGTAAAAASGSLTAQDVKLVSDIGVYVPTQDLIDITNGGVGIVNRSGAAFADLDDKTDLSGTFGAALAIRVGSFLSLKFSGESYIYNPDFLNSLAEEVNNLQNDLNLSVGFGIPLMGLGAGT